MAGAYLPTMERRSISTYTATRDHPGTLKRVGVTCTQIVTLGLIADFTKEDGGNDRNVQIVLGLRSWL